MSHLKFICDLSFAGMMYFAVNNSAYQAQDLLAWVLTASEIGLKRIRCALKWNHVTKYIFTTKSRAYNYIFYSRKQFYDHEIHILKFAFTSDDLNLLLLLIREWTNRYMCVYQNKNYFTFTRQSNLKKCTKTRF